MLKLEKEINRLIAIDSSAILSRLSEPKLKRVNQKIIDLLTRENLAFEIQDQIDVGNLDRAGYLLSTENGLLPPEIFNGLNRRTKPFINSFHGQVREKVTAIKTSFIKKGGNGHL
jgi:hypothetical protein